jgi:hypothetical protein
LVGAIVAPVALATASPTPSGATIAEAAPLRALLVVDVESKTTIVTLAGKRVPVPARVRESPRGLSPDARLIAKGGADAVLLGPVRGGVMRPVLRGKCPTKCPHGTDPTFAWSPDGLRLAATANPARGPTLLQLFDRSGRKVRSVTLPGTNAEQGGRAFHKLHSWSPDGSRILLERESEFGLTALAVLDLDTGRLRTLSKISGPGASVSAAWSPEGGFVAFTSSGSHDAQDMFFVIDVPSGRPMIKCPRDVRGPPTECPGGSVWASDSKSVFGPGLDQSRINRYSLDGRRASEISSNDKRTWLRPHLATASGLIYSTSDQIKGGGELHLHSFATRRGKRLLVTARGISSVLPLARLP